MKLILEIPDAWESLLGLGFHEAEAFFKRHGAEQQPNWEELEASGEKLRAALQA